jgi:hypothetical protein
VQTIFNTPFSLKLDTCVLAVNLMDIFASRKGQSTVIVAVHLLRQLDAEDDGRIIGTATWQTGKIADEATQFRALLLLAGTALMVASKYEENQSSQVGMAVVAHVLGIDDFTKWYKSRLATIERVFLQVIDWDLGVPGPLPFLRHFIHEQRMRSEAAITGNKDNESYWNFHSNQEYALKKESASEEDYVELVAESCIRVAMTQHNVTWYGPNVIARICYLLALYLVQSFKPDGYKDLLTDHGARMENLAFETQLSTCQVRHAISTLLLHILNDPFSDRSFCWWKILTETRGLTYWLLNEENLYLQQLSLSLCHKGY